MMLTVPMLVSLALTIGIFAATIFLGAPPRPRATATATATQR